MKCDFVCDIEKLVLLQRNMNVRNMYVRNMYVRNMYVRNMYVRNMYGNRKLFTDIFNAAEKYTLLSDICFLNLVINGIQMC